MVEGLRRELNWLKNTSITTSKVEKRLNLRWGNMTKDLEWKRTVIGVEPEGDSDVGGVANCVPWILPDG